MSTDARPPLAQHAGTSTDTSADESGFTAAPPVAAVAPRPARGNAVRHGLTAVALVDQLVGDEAYERLATRLQEELHTQRTLLEETLVRRITQHVAALDLARRAELAALREGCVQAVVLGPVATAAAGLNAAGSSPNITDAPLCAAVSSEVLERITRYGRSHERGLLASVRELRKLTEERQQRVTAERMAFGATRARPPAAMADVWGDDAACEAYLVDRLRSARYPCPYCGATRGYWLPRRHRRECGTCRKQAGARTGTVMAGSPLRLSIWFLAIQSLVAQPDLAVAELAAVLGIRRLPTVRSLAQRSSPPSTRLTAAGFWRDWSRHLPRNYLKRALRQSYFCETRPGTIAVAKCVKTPRIQSHCRCHAPPDGYRRLKRALHTRRSAASCWPD